MSFNYLTPIYFVVLSVTISCFNSMNCSSSEQKQEKMHVEFGEIRIPSDARNSKFGITNCVIVWKTSGVKSHPCIILWPNFVDQHVVYANSIPQQPQKKDELRSMYITPTFVALGTSSMELPKSAVLLVTSDYSLIEIDNSDVGIKEYLKTGLKGMSKTKWWNTNVAPAVITQSMSAYKDIYD